jgi:multiple sugar transport system substrate-binding protein
MLESQSVPAPEEAGASPSRRSVLKGIAGVAGLAAAAPALAACGSSGGGSPKTSSAGGGGQTSAATGGGGSGGSITFGSNYSDPQPKGAFAALTKAATTKTNVKISINTVDHNTFQNNISSYLQGTPNDLATWFAGYRLQFFAAQNLLDPIDDVWDSIGGNFNDATKNLSKGVDGHYYLVPIYNYPWVVFYNKSVFSSKGYQIPKTWDDFIALAKQMQKDGLVPLAFAEKDGWPALGTFDILNLRINGYDYHIKLMQHKVPWTDKGVTAVFDHWRELMPYLQKGANGRLWQDGAKTLENKQAGMMFQGTNQVAANYSAKNLPDLDFFVYPEINSQWGQDYMDAPTDGFILPKKGKNKDAAKEVLKYIGTADAEATFLQTDHWDVGVAQGLVAPTYNAIQKKSVQVISACKSVSQFMDRDTVPDMATAMIKLIQSFIDNPSASNVQSIQKSAESQAKSIFS